MHERLTADEFLALFGRTPDCSAWAPLRLTLRSTSRWSRISPSVRSLKTIAKPRGVGELTSGFECVTLRLQIGAIHSRVDIRELGIRMWCSCASPRRLVTRGRGQSR